MAGIGSYPDPGEIVYSSRFLKSDLTLTQSQLQLGRRGGGSIRMLRGCFYPGTIIVRRREGGFKPDQAFAGPDRTRQTIARFLSICQKERKRIQTNLALAVAVSRLQFFNGTLPAELESGYPSPTRQSTVCTCTWTVLTNKQLYLLCVDAPMIRPGLGSGC